MNAGEQAVTVREDSLAPAAVHARMQYARALAASGLLPDAYRGNPANVLLAIEYGQALGVKPIAALQGISVIKGKPTMSSDLMASVVRQAGHRLRIHQEGMSVTATLIRRDDPEFQFTATWDEQRARQAGLWGSRGPWSLYPEQMLRARAITEVCRQGASDCLFGVIYTPEELSPTGPPPAAPVDWGGHAGADDVVADLNRQCADLVRRFTAKFGGDPEQIAAAWEHDGGVADPEALTRWLMARIPHATEQDETIGETITDMEAFARSVADRVLASEEGDTE